MKNADIRKILDSLPIEVKTSESLAHPGLPCGCYLDAESLVKLVTAVEVAALAQVVLSSPSAKR